MDSKPVVAARSIEDHANSMFRFERLHDAWIERCSRYLRHVFGDRIEGATVIDYAFGRGNWSMAFVRAGAARVIAVDASPSNVERFRRYCATTGVRDVDVRCGNALDGDLGVRADILWLYGILPEIADQAAFIEAVLELVPGPDALVLAYAYDRWSLRELVVTQVRAFARYESEEAFRSDALRFTPAARLRARDDLTAQCVNWHSAEGLAAQFEGAGFRPIRQLKDFRVVDAGWDDAEFAPHHLLLARATAARVEVAEPERRHAKDIEILRSLWEILIPRLGAAQMKDLAITVFNTHFSHLAAGGDPRESVVQHLLLLLYAIRANDIAAPDASLAARVMSLAGQAMSGSARGSVPGMDDAFLVQYLTERTIRI